MENNLNKNDRESVKITLERHKWPDEIKKERQRNFLIFGLTLAVVASFTLGWITNGVLNTSTATTAVTNNTQLKRFEEVYKTLLNKWYFSNDMTDPSSQLIDNAINGMLDINGDIHTSYLSAKQATDLSQTINGEFVGIGVQYNASGGLNMITKVFKNSPAEKAGIKAGDRIISVDGEDVTSFTSDQLVEKITGELGTTVVVGLQRGGENLTLSIVRDTVNSLAYGYMMDNNVGYLELTSFGQSLYTVSKSYLADFASQGATKLIIDLRSNGGGYLSAIEEVSKLFIPKGDTIYQIENKDGSIDVSKARDVNEYNYDKIVILINGGTASASEVLTLALKENASLNVSVVGDVSYGKGTAQTQVSLSDGGVLKYTYAKWLDPQGNNINGQGITPDVAVKLNDFFYQTYPELSEGEQYPFDTVGSPVSYVQYGLRYLGYSISRVDGYYDSTTLTAMKAFQTTQGLTEDGVITQDIIERINSAATKYYYENIQQQDVQLIKAAEVINQ